MGRRWPPMKRDGPPGTRTVPANGRPWQTPRFGGLPPGYGCILAVFRCVADLADLAAAAYARTNIFASTSGDSQSD